ncbi:hypothetical protein [Parasphingorhabdus cellanae]|uniref:DUF465 domain-containing protein n=1 Tax=Parasphingorhabdus cellanae TaxID=2806553 RepID=A0ABX7T3Y6_9SPHN|nr:hypothetical protein [Parasphingorhabdus cellanae]QTD54960.1 hypothetical protein J4G78_12010 [Parasphingorhabdus cellanae]
MKKYLNSLIRKHRKLDKQISQARIDRAKIHDMKRLRLKLKNQIACLRRGPERQPI